MQLRTAFGAVDHDGRALEVAVPAADGARAYARAREVLRDRELIAVGTCVRRGRRADVAIVEEDGALALVEIAPTELDLKHLPTPSSMRGVLQRFEEIDHLCARCVVVAAVWFVRFVDCCGGEIDRRRERPLDELRSDVDLDILERRRRPEWGMARGAFDRFDLRLQQAVISSVVALDGADRLKEVPMTLRPTDPNAFGFSVSGFTIDEGRALVQAWVLNASENRMEDFAVFVEDTMAILTNADEVARRAFNLRTFPDKLEALRVALGTVNVIRNLDCVESLNVARNCLMHRAGVVGARDVTDAATQSLVLRYSKQHIATISRDESPAAGMLSIDEDFGFIDRTIETSSFGSVRSSSSPLTSSSTL